jgi:uncharacterized membrane protein
MDIQAIKDYVKPKVEENAFSLFGVYVIFFIYKIAFPFHIFFFFIEPGINYYMIRFVNGKRTYVSDMFRYIEKMWDFFWTGLLRNLCVFGRTLLLIVPGVIAHYEYLLVPLILTDPKLKDVRGRKCLKLSKEMLRGHIMECFLLDLSFIWLHILGIFSLGILEIYVLPFQMSAKYKLLYEIKKQYTGEEESFMMDSDATYTPVKVIHRKESKALEVHRDQEGNFVAHYCLQCGKPLPPNSKSCIYCGYIYEEDENAKI